MPTDTEKMANVTDEDNNRAELWCAMNLPREWFNDPHGEGDGPLCCGAIASLATVLAATRDEARAAARREMREWHEERARECDRIGNLEGEAEEIIRRSLDANDWFAKARAHRESAERLEEE